MSTTAGESTIYTVPVKGIERRQLINRYLGADRSLEVESRVEATNENTLATARSEDSAKSTDVWVDQNAYFQFRSYDGETFFCAKNADKDQARYKRLQDLDNGVYREGVYEPQSRLNRHEKRQIDFKARAIESICGQLGMERQKNIQDCAKRRIFDIRDLRTDVRGFSCTYKTALTIVAIEHKLSRDDWDRIRKRPLEGDVLKGTPIGKQRSKPIAETKAFERQMNEYGLNRYTIRKAGKSIYDDEYESPFLTKN